jgi:hypothetical protein
MLKRASQDSFGSSFIVHPSTFSALTISRDANTGAGEDFTDLAAAVQLRLRVAPGLQALQRCSGLLNR